MANILVTGSQGQLGSEIKDASFYDRENKFFFTNHSELDVLDINALRFYVANNSIDVIINCVAYTAVDKAEIEKNIAENVNHIGVKNLAIVCKEKDATLIHISTDYVFDGTKNTPYLETDKVSPLGVYGTTKYAGEVAIKESGCKSIIIRTAWLYSFYGSNFVKTIRRVAKKREHMNVVFDQIGTPTYANDLARSILYILPKIIEKPRYAEVYNYTNEGVASWYDFARYVVDLSDIPCVVSPIESFQYPTPAKRPSYSVLNKRKIKEEFGLSIPYWGDSLLRCILKMNVPEILN